MSDFDQFRTAILDLITLQQARLDAVALPDPDLEAALEDLETTFAELVGKTTPAEQEEIGKFYQEALEVFGSNEDIFNSYPDAAGLLYWLRFEVGRRPLMEGLRPDHERGAAYLNRPIPNSL